MIWDWLETNVGRAKMIRRCRGCLLGGERVLMCMGCRWMRRNASLWSSISARRNGMNWRCSLTVKIPWWWNINFLRRKEASSCLLLLWSREKQEISCDVEEAAMFVLLREILSCTYRIGMNRWELLTGVIAAVVSTKSSAVCCAVAATSILVHNW